MIVAAQSAPFMVYRFLDLTIDCGRRLVRRGDVVLAVGGLSFDLLVVLLEGAPNIVTADELMARVWPGVIVNPETISQRVKLLRQALGDDARAPRYIAVVRGRGYRAIGAVKVAPPEGSGARERGSWALRLRGWCCCSYGWCCERRGEKCARVAGRTVGYQRPMTSAVEHRAGAIPASANPP